MASSKPLVGSRDFALWAGIGFTMLGAVLLWDAHEHRGVSRPFLLKFLPSP